MKRYTYNYEMLFYNRAYTKRMLIIASVVIAALILPVTFVIKGILLLAVGLLSLIAFLNTKRECYERGKIRRYMMKNGIKMSGTVVASGGHKYWGEQSSGTYDDHNNRDQMYGTKLSDWWIEVEYYDTVKLEMKRFKAQNMNADGKHLIGASADIYIKGSQAYVDIPVI